MKDKNLFLKSTIILIISGFFTKTLGFIIRIVYILITIFYQINVSSKIIHPLIKIIYFKIESFNIITKINSPRIISPRIIIFSSYSNITFDKLLHYKFCISIL